jgi:hypothetical protein
MKLFFSTVLLTVLSVAATAQNLTLGVKAGSSTTTFKGDYTYSNSSIYDNPKTSSFVLTEYLNYKLTSMLSVQAELSYQKKGFEYKTKKTVVDYTANGKAEFGYLQIPILVQFSYGDKLKVFANGGPSINILVSDGYYNFRSTQGAVINSYVTPRFNGVTNIKSDFNKVTLGLVGSAGLSYDITSCIGVLGEFRVGYDLSKSSKNINRISIPEEVPLDFNDTHFLSYTIQGGIYFRLGQ